MSIDQAGSSSYPYEHYEPFDERAALRNQIARTRADLGGTISELAARTDVKARAREMVSDVRSRATDAMRIRARGAASRTRGAARAGASTARSRLGGAGRSPLGIVAGAGAGALAGWAIFELLRRRRAGPAWRRGGWR